MPLHAGLQAKCPRLIGNRVAESISGDKFATGSRINVRTVYAQTLSSKVAEMVSRARNDQFFIGYWER